MRTTNPSWTLARATSPTIGPSTVSKAGSIPPVSWNSAAIAPSAPATTTSLSGTPVPSSRRIHATPASAGSMSTPAAAMIFGIDPRVAIPMPPHAVQSIASARTPGRVRRRLLNTLHCRSLAAL